MQGNYESARAYYEQSLVIRRQLGDRSQIASLLEPGALAGAIVPLRPVPLDGFPIRANQSGGRLFHLNRFRRDFG
jgi:hypothetical protein